MHTQSRIALENAISTCITFSSTYMIRDPEMRIEEQKELINRIAEDLHTIRKIEQEAIDLPC